MKSVLYVGPFPKPTHGQSIATLALHDQLLHTHEIEKIDTSGGAQSNWSGRLTAHVSAALKTLFDKRPLYVSANSNRGMWLTAMIVVAASLRKKKVLVHHHAYDQIRRKRRDMTVMCSIGGRNSTHVVLAPPMAEELIRRFPGMNKPIVCNNSGFIDKSLLEIQLGESKEDIVLGHLSNLTLDKGITRVVETAILLAHDQAVRLVIAGPIVDDVARGAIDRAKTVLGPGKFTYLGPVYGREKVEFFKRIDVFLFPSTYQNEAEPIVLLEAMAAGKPCIAYDIGCIAYDLSNGGGVAVNCGQHFEAMAAEHIRIMINEGIRGFSTSARQRYLQLLLAQKSQFEEIRQYLT